MTTRMNAPAFSFWEKGNANSPKLNDQPIPIRNMLNEQFLICAARKAVVRTNALMHGLYWNQI